MALDLETREQLIDTVRRFVAERLRPIEAKVAEDDAVPAEVVEEMKGLGLFGLSIPEEFGGLGLNMEEECLVGIELGRASPAFRSVFGTNVGIGSQGLVMFGTDEQKAKWLPGIASGEIVTSFALTEPEAGSDSAAVQTRATRDGDDYVLNGGKRFITNAGKAVAVHGDGPHQSRRQGRLGRLGLPGAERPAGAFREQAREEDGPAGRPHPRRDLRQCPRAGLEPAGAGGRGLQGGHAGAGPRAAAHLGGLRGRGRAADRRLRGLCLGAKAVRRSRWPVSRWSRR